MAAWIPIAISSLLGGIAAGANAHSATTANRRNAIAAAVRRQRLLKLIDKINDRDLSGMDAAASDVFSRGADQIEANAAQRGVLNAPNAGANRQMNEVFAQVMANLAEARANDQRQAQSLTASLLGDQSFGVPSASSFNPGSAALLAGLGGAAGAGGQAFGNFLGTDSGISFLNSLFGDTVGGATEGN